MNAKNKELKRKIKEMYLSLLFINLYPLHNSFIIELNKNAEILEKMKNKVLLIKGKETEDNIKEVYEDIENMKKLCQQPFQEKMKNWIKSNDDKVYNWFKENLKEDFYYIPWTFFKDNFVDYFNINRRFLLYPTTKYGIFLATGTFISPERELMENALSSYFIMNMKLEFDNSIENNKIRSTFNKYRVREFYLKNTMINTITFMEAIINNVLYVYYKDVNQNKIDNILSQKNLEKCKTGKGNFNEKFKILETICPVFRDIKKSDEFKNFERIKNMRNELVHPSPNNSVKDRIDNFEKISEVVLKGIKGSLYVAKAIMQVLCKNLDLSLYLDFEYDKYEKVCKEFCNI